MKLSSDTHVKEKKQINQKYIPTSPTRLKALVLIIFYEQ